MARSTFKFRDYDNDTKQISVLSDDVLVAANYAAALTLHQNLSSAISAVILGNKAEDAYTPRVIEVSALPASPVAQTNVQWLVTYRDSVDGHIEHLSIPTADIADGTLRLPNSSLWDPTHADWVAFKSAFEALAVSNLGNSVTIDQVEFKE